MSKHPLRITRQIDPDDDGAVNIINLAQTYRGGVTIEDTAGAEGHTLTHNATTHELQITGSGSNAVVRLTDVTAAALLLEATGAKTDEGLWRFNASHSTTEGQFKMQAANDAAGSFVTFLQVDRTGTTVDTITLTSTDINLAANLKINGDSVIKTAHVTLTSAQILALNATPISVLAAPGSGLCNLIRRIYATKAAGTAYAGIAAGEDIEFRYTNSSGSRAAILEMTGFADSASATQGLAVSEVCQPVANADIVAFMASGEITTGNSRFKLVIEYQTVAVPAF